jgi:putative transposase
MELRDAAPVAQLRELAQRYPRWGYRRALVMLRRQGTIMSKNRVHRLWKKAELQVPARRRRRRGGKRDPMTIVATRPNQVWAYDFVFDSCLNGEKLKCLTIVDEFTQEVLAIDVAGSIRSQRVIDLLARLIATRGAPMLIRSDNGPEFIAQVVKDWLEEKGVRTAFIEPGKPWQNAKIESFNGRFRDECLNQECFFNRAEARVIIEDFRKEFNQLRPHGSLANKTPLEFYRDFRQENNQLRLTA